MLQKLVMYHVVCTLSVFSFLSLSFEGLCEGGQHLKQGDGELLDGLGEVGFHDTAAQAVVPHQPPAAVLAQVEVLRHSTRPARTRLWC